MRLKYYRREIYTLDLADKGVPLESFLRHNKRSMIEKFLENYEAEKLKTARIEFTVQSPSDEVLFSEVQKYQRADGQYVYRGDFTAREIIEEKIRTSAKVVTMTVYLD